MDRPRINAREIVNDILSGLDDIALMEKYRLSSKGLHSLVNKLIAAGLLRRRDDTASSEDRRRRINGRQFVADLTSGMSESRLMRKYGLSPKTLQRVCSKLLASRNRSAREFQEEIPIDETTVVQANVRQVQRYYPDFVVPIYESASPEIQGRVRDISEEGVGVVGVEASTYEIKTFVVLGDPFGEVGSFEFEAECRWAKASDGQQRNVSGYRIVEIEEADLTRLRKLIHLIALRA
ncbi:MAG: PilZ domain-containing protein [Desulfomonilaceae bacterium]|nr:PilZ domain-containing protein [Desulfomonilaceae bacterium]